MTRWLIMAAALVVARAGDLSADLEALRAAIDAPGMEDRLRSVCQKREDLAACEAWGVKTGEELRKRNGRQWRAIGVRLLTVLRDLRHAGEGAASENAEVLTRLAELVYVDDGAAPARALFEQARTLLSAEGRAESTAMADVLADLAVLSGDQSEYQKSIELHLEALRLRRKLLPPRDIAIAHSLNDLGEAYDSTGDYAQAERYLKESQAIAEIANPEGEVLAEVLSNLAELYHTLSKYTEAQTLYERALRIELAIDPNATDAAVVMANLASLYNARGEFARAEPLLKRALAIREGAYGPIHPAVGNSLNNLGALYSYWGQFAKAEEYYRQAIAIEEQAVAPDSPDAATYLDNLGGALIMQGRYAEALPALQQALAIREKKLGIHNDTARTLTDLGHLYYWEGDYAKAEPLFRRALEIHRKTLPEGHPDTLIDMEGLARLYHAEGALAKSETIEKEVIALTEKKVSLIHHDTGIAISGLADIYRDEKRYRDAAALYEQALDIFEKALPPLHPDIAGALNNAGAIYALLGDFERAEGFHRRALEIQDKAIAVDHPDRAVTLSHLAKVEFGRGNFAGAKQNYVSAIGILGNSVGPDHPDLLALETDYARVLWRMGQRPGACVELLKANRAVTEFWARTLIAVEEPRRRSLVAKFGDLFPLTMSLAAEWRREDPQAASRLAAVAIAARKGIQSSARQEVYARVLRDRNAKALSLYAELTANAEQQGRTIRDSSAEGRAKLALLRQKEDEIEQKLIAASAHYRHWRAPVDPEAISAAVPVGAAFVDIARYARVDPATGKERENRYAAVVYKRGAAPRLVMLGSGDAVDEAVKKVRSNFENMWPTQSGQPALIGGAAFQQNLRHTESDCAELYRLTFAGLREAIGPARRLLISPDARLAEVPWEAMRNGAGKYLIEEGYRITYLDSAHSLLAPGSQATPHSPIVVVANVDYDGKPSEASVRAANQGLALESEEIPGGGAEHPGSMKWKPLHGGDEILATMRELAGKGELGPVVKLAKGSEEEMLALDRPAAVIVHTHGFFWTPSAGPMIDGLNSGIVLYGANRADEPDRKGRDGWLTAKEVMLLNLDGTRLAAFLGCDTGRGAEAGEGVQGLRHALAVAGARSTLLTLWQVGDLSSARFLRELLLRVARSPGVPLEEALAETRLAFLRGEVVEAGGGINRWSHPYFWAAATLAGQGGPIDLGAHPKSR